MVIIYIVIAFLIVLAAACCIVPYLMRWNPKVSSNKELEAENHLSLASPRIKRACKYKCPHCGGNLLPEENLFNVKCCKCGNLWHPDYIFSVYEDSDL